jgi:hypothetical protein
MAGATGTRRPVRNRTTLQSVVQVALVTAMIDNSYKSATDKPGWRDLNPRPPRVEGVGRRLARTLCTALCHLSYSRDASRRPDFNRKPGG